MSWRIAARVGMALLVGALVYALLSDDIHLKYVTAFCLGYILGDIVFKITSR